MTGHQEIDRLITSAARQHLRPLGLRRKGRSRLWYADHGWWLAVRDGGSASTS